ncbi:hypothetical protein SLEP1_g36009 [Rubroshorea leprosula]|uniref:non-specific serine/threonine protein kinase n=1 Tax=Rubroshorea leprosula TaxID=152421 RepID=A0AAV5KQD5_9ROSI|nr:hypothetical protein SLEP1_g36009 [Rubroshorea leprosula]
MLMGAHIARLVRAPNPALFLLLLVSALSFSTIAFGETDADILLHFKNSLGNPSALSNWVPSKGPCNWDRANWVGVICSNGTIWGLQLESIGLTGKVNFETLVPLRSLRAISLMNNNFEGPMPDIRRLSSLKAFYISNNGFSGEIPDGAFQGMGSLKKLYLANNAFTGQIPSSLGTLPMLLVLRLESNQFEGQIPEFHQKYLKVMNVANNELEGPIPASLSKMSPTSFSGNKNLCGPPLQQCGSPPAPKPSSETNKISILKIALILLAMALALAIIALCILFAARRSPKSKVDELDDSNKLPPPSPVPREHSKLQENTGVVASSKKTEPGKLSFLKDDVEKFDLQDMLRASAEVLGSGTFGSSYKAVIMNGLALVVKRYKQMNNVGREDFHEHMRRLGRLRHPNLLPVVAYYYRREEKLMISQYVENCSLASHLHANHSVQQPGLDWRTRLRIIKGVARGLAYLYNELPSLIVPHGHLKSSNVLLDESFEPLLTDYALRPVVNPEHAHMLMISYKSPEYAKTGRITRKTDVWCLGILILEVLTGKFPENYLTQGYNSSASLASWVNAMVTERKTSEVFDKEMGGIKNSKSEMINLLKIGLSCCEEDLETRPELKEVLEKIEELSIEGDSDIEEFSSTVGEVAYKGVEEDLDR